MAAKKTSKPAKPSAADEPRLARGRTRPGAIFPVAPPASSLPESYAATLQEIKSHLRQARVRAVLAANPIVIEAYWQTGKIILARQQESAWGAKVIDRLAADLQEAFPVSIRYKSFSRADWTRRFSCHLKKKDSFIIDLGLRL